jgi:DNA-binding XRE family transcriptional regulator
MSSNQELINRHLQLGVEEYTYAVLEKNKHLPNRELSKLIYHTLEDHLKAVMDLVACNTRISVLEEKIAVLQIEK